MPPATVFFFAHQDDEMGVLPVLAKLATAGRRVICLYLTDGAFLGANPDRRNLESLSVLARLGIGADAVRFIGAKEAIPDGALAQHLARADDAIAKCLDAAGPIDRIIMHAYEGGHQDHDAVHVLGICAARRTGSLSRARQFTLYRATTVPLMPHVMFRPLASNGPVERTPISMRQRMHYLWLCLSYRSQPMTLLGLWPLMAVDYAVDGQQKLQPVEPLRLHQRPHPGPLLYERRGRGNFADFQKSVEPFLNQRHS